MCANQRCLLRTVSPPVATTWRTVGRRHHSVSVPRSIFSGRIHELLPYRANPFLEFGDGAVVLDYVIRPGALQLCGHLRRNHLHGLGLVQPAIAHQPLQPERARRVYQDHQVKLVCEAPLEKQGNVRYHDALSALARVLEFPVTQTLHFRVHYLIQCF